LRRYRDLLHALPPLQFPPLDWVASFDGRPLVLPLGLGTLRLAGNTQALDEPVQVRFRRGGESLRLASGGHSRELRDLFQEAGIPPWQRGRLPLLFSADGDLLAVADLWRAEDAGPLLGGEGGRIEWDAAAGANRPASGLRAIDLAGVLS
jgi:tRNA(Ile)-lysidine synthase